MIRRRTAQPQHLVRHPHPHPRNSEAVFHSHPGLPVFPAIEAGQHWPHGHGRGWEQRRQRFEELREQIESTKVVRLQLQPAADTSVVYSLCGNRRGQVKIQRNKETMGKGLWLMHRLKSGEVMLAPMKAPRSFLRCFQDGMIDLSMGGIGERTRWNITPASTGNSVMTPKQLPDLRLALVNDAESVVARGIDSSSSSIGFNFTLQEVDSGTALAGLVFGEKDRRPHHHHRGGHGHRWNRQRAFLRTCHAALPTHSRPNRQRTTEIVELAERLSLS